MASGQERTGPLLLLDGMSLAFRAYFALPDTLATSTGVVTNAVHGFTSMLVYLIREQRPSALAVAFDAPGATFRDEILEDYKAGRAETPWLLPPQFDMIREVMAALAIPVIEAPGFEADDVLATLATEAVERQTEVVIVTGDRDSFQLVQDPYVRVLYNKRGVSDYTLYDESGIFDRCGVPPSQYVLLASLRGDPSDNLPGIPGVGEKTAAKLLTKYGDLDGIFEHLDEQTPKLRENLADNEELARSNARIIPLVRDVPLDVDVTHLTLGAWDRATAAATFERFEMKTVWSRLEELLDAGALGEPVPGSAGPAAKGAEAAVAAATRGQPAPAEPALPPFELHDLALPTTASEVTTRLTELGTGRLALAARWNGMPGRSELVALVLVATEGEEAGRGVLVPAAQLGAGSVVKKLNSMLARPFVGHEVKEAMRSLLPLGIDLTGLEMDTGVAAYLLDASTGEYQLSQLREQTGQLSLDILDPGETARDVAQEAGGEAADVAAMALNFRQRIASEGMTMLHDDIETPLVRVLAKMEVAGIGVDRAELQTIADSLKESAAALQRRGAGTRRPRVQRQFDAPAADRALRRARPHAGQEDQDRLLDRRADAGEPARRPSDHRRAALLPRGGEAALDLRREPARRGGRRRAHPRVVRADRGPHGPHFVGPPQPAQHPGAHRPRQAVPPGLRAGGGVHLLGGRLRPGRTALHRESVAGPRLDRRADERVGRAPDGGRGGVRDPARGGDPHPAGVLEDGLLRPGLRHGGLRTEPASRRPRRGGRRHHGELLRRLPAREAVHGPRRGRRQDPGCHPHHVRPHPPVARPRSRRTTGCARRRSARP